MGDNTLAIIGLIVAAVTAIGVFLGPRFTAKWQRRQEKQDMWLKAHFEELKREAQEIIRIISRVTENYGQIVSHSQVIHSEFTAVVLPQPSDTFTAHFPEEAEDCRKYEEKIRKHNQDYERFRLRISNLIESQEIPVVNPNSPVTPCVYDSIFAPLFQRWKELATGGRPWPDFSKIQQVDVEGGYIHLYPEAWSASTAAHVREKGDKERCERILREIAENKEFEEETAKLISSAKQLTEDISAWRRQLIEKLDSIDRYWPGTQSYKFKREKKKCSRCKQIFS